MRALAICCHAVPMQAPFPCSSFQLYLPPYSPAPDPAATIPLLRCAPGRVDKRIRVAERGFTQLSIASSTNRPTLPDQPDHSRCPGTAALHALAGSGCCTRTLARQHMLRVTLLYVRTIHQCLQCLQTLVGLGSPLTLPHSNHQTSRIPCVLETAT